MRRIRRPLIPIISIVQIFPPSSSLIHTNRIRACICGKVLMNVDFSMQNNGRACARERERDREFLLLSSSQPLSSI